MTVTARPAVAVEVLLEPGERLAALREDAARGLSAVPKELPPKWFYDGRGSELFDEITRLPEYYLTQAERSILLERAGEIADVTGADTLVELGSGTSEKTRILLDAVRAAGRLRRFSPFDASEEVLRASASAIAAEYPGIEVRGVVGDFEIHLDRLPREGRRLVCFLGSTIGNLRPSQRVACLKTIANGLRDGEALLVGVDLVKDPARLHAAYDDSRGVTAEFNRNVLRVLNRELGANFVPERFEHVARWNEREQWVEMLLRSSVAQAVRVEALGLEVAFAAGEELRTEISAKFRRERVEHELAEASLGLLRWWTDAAGDFALLLAAR